MRRKAKRLVEQRAAVGCGKAQPRDRAATEQWWRNFNDPELDRLVAEAQRQNIDVRIAGLRILEARAQLGIAGSTLYPQLQQLTGEALRAGQQQSNGPDSAAWRYRVGLDIAWELDFWGKFRRGIESADAAYFEHRQLRRVQVLVAAQAASFYATMHDRTAPAHCARERRAAETQP